MSDDPILALTDLLVRENGRSLPADIRLSVSLSLAKVLIGRGDLDQAASVLDDIVAADADQRRLVTGLRLLVLRRRAEQRQRLKQWPEAVAAWRLVIELNPVDSNAYLSLARAHEQQRNDEQALQTYIQLVEAIPTARSYLTVAPRLTQLAGSRPASPAARQVRIALAGNATNDQLGNYLSVECYRAGLQPTVYIAGFDQVVQEILDPGSGLYQFQPEVLICALHASRLFPRLHHDPFELTAAERRGEIESGLSTVEQLLDSFTARSSATVLLHNMVAPQHPALGIADLRDELGQAELFAEINRRLAELVRTRYRSVYIVDEERVQARTGKARATDPRL